jgi:putative toxin-antitoxin system antitoxin component (TIGR02293 family)
MLRPEYSSIGRLLDISGAADQLPVRCPTRAGYRLVDILGVKEGQLAECGLSLLSPRRRRGDLTAAETQRLYRAAAAWLMAMRVFDDSDKAQRFIASPSVILKGRAPLEVASEGENGLQAVEGLLGRLYYGTAT